MKPLWFITLILQLLAMRAVAAPSCSAILDENIVTMELDSLAAYQVTVSQLPSASQKTLGMKEVRRRLRELEERHGRDLKEEFRALVKSERELAILDKDQKRIESEREQAEQREKVEKLTRIRKLGSRLAGSHLEFIDDHRLAIKNSSDLQIYDITKPQDAGTQLADMKGQAIAYGAGFKTAYTFGISAVTTADLTTLGAPGKKIFPEINKLVTNAVVSPNGEFLAAGADWGRIHIFKIPSLEFHVDSLEVNAPTSVMRFSSGSRFLFAAARELVPSRYLVFDLITKERLELPTYMKDVGTTVSDAAFQPGSHTLYIATREGRLSRWDLDTGVYDKSPWPAAKAEYLQFSPSGKYLFMSDGDGRTAGASVFGVVETATGKEVEIDPALKGATLVARGVSRDGTKLIAWTRLPREEKAILLHVIETETFKTHTSRVAIADDVISPVFSPDGASIYVSTGFELVQIY